MVRAKVIVVFSALFLIVMFAGAIFLLIFLDNNRERVSPDPAPSATRDTHKKDGVDAEIYQYKKGKCLIINRLDCPPGWGPITVLKCEDKLEKCESKYEALQKFCNVNCEEDLEACQQDLQYVRENCFYSKMGLYL